MEVFLFRCLTVIALCLGTFGWPVGVWADEASSRAQALLNANRPAQALAVLEPLEAERAGDPDFDYLLALATLDAGAPAKATMIFERLLLISPAFHGARIDLARAYFQLERYADAQREFETALANAPPPRARQLIEDYLARIKARTRKLRFARFIDISTRAGYDSNVNSATEANEFLGFNLNPISREQDSEFFEAGIKLGGAMRLRPALKLDGRVNVQVRRNPQASFADSEVFSGALRLRHERAGQRRTIAVQAYGLRLDGDSNSSAANVVGDWQFRIGQSWWLGPLARFGIVRYEDSLQIKDANQWALGATASWQFGTSGQGALNASLLGGHDDPRDAASRYERDFIRLSGSLNWRFHERVAGMLSASYEDSDYDTVFFEQAFTQPRSDITYRGRGTLDWRMTRRWHLSHSLSYTLNVTDISVFEYERFELGLGLRYVLH